MLPSILNTTGHNSINESVNEEEVPLGLSAKYSKYVVHHFKLSWDRWWVFIPVLLYDSAIFITQFFYLQSVYRVKMFIIFQFFLSLLTVVMFLLRWRVHPEDQINELADETDVRTERKKLAENEKFLKL